MVGHRRHLLPPVAHQSMHKTHHGAGFAGAAFEVRAGVVHVVHGFHIAVEPELVEQPRSRAVLAVNERALVRVGITVHVPGHKKVHCG